MNFNFELILFYATVISGVIALLDIFFLAPRRQKKNHPADKMPAIIDYARSFFPVLLVVFLLRSFLYEPFRIPSGSLKPTLLPGDFVLVNKFDYGIRLPVIHQKIVPVHAISRGDIIVFRYPVDPSIDFIKRVIGLPGDKISYINKVLFVNGKQISQTFEKNTTDHDDLGSTWTVVQKQEDLLGVKHAIFQNPDKSDDDLKEVVVPPGMYFAMGDNRDDSADSRYWGFVPDQNIIGKASIVWMSWDSDADLLHKIRWSRIGSVIH
ncbi:MAG TPA: signal peptidase I [Gammaproteobacteria bacterium]|nr:signal peptidase I [Gammaproteobacteria bacterium]